MPSFGNNRSIGDPCQDGDCELDHSVAFSTTDNLADRSDAADYRNDLLDDALANEAEEDGASRLDYGGGRGRSELSESYDAANNDSGISEMDESGMYAMSELGGATTVSKHDEGGGRGGLRRSQHTDDVELTTVDGRFTVCASVCVDGDADISGLANDAADADDDNGEAETVFSSSDEGVRLAAGIDRSRPESNPKTGLGSGGRSDGRPMPSSKSKKYNEAAVIRHSTKYPKSQAERPRRPTEDPLLKDASKRAPPSDKLTNQRKRNRTVLAVFASVLGLVAIGMGFVFALDLMDFGGGGGKSTATSGSEVFSQSSDVGSGGWEQGGGGAAGPTAHPTGMPTSSKPTTAEPTTKPVTLKPTEGPTLAPTKDPTHKPTNPPPTFRPTTSSPTPAPTPNLWTSSPTAELAEGGSPPPPGYFNYDPDDELYGPTIWSSPQYSLPANVSRDQEGVLLSVEPSEEASPEFKFWSQHAGSINTNKKTNFTENFCDPTAIWGRGGKWRAEQSPIDVRVTEEVDEQTGELVEARCFEHHEIRRKPGQFRLANTKITKQILPSQLRLNYPEPKFDSDGNLASDSKLPLADFPHGWGGNMEVLRVDVKIPSEHWLEGKEFAAEYQIYHLHHKKKKAPVVSILIDLHPRNVKNLQFQLALNEWQKVWELNYLECEDQRRRERRLDVRLFEAVQSWVRADNKIFRGDRDRGYSTWLDEPLDEERTFKQHLRSARKAQEEGAYWDPYHVDLMRSIHFYGYSGSLTEPPCTEFVEWRIVDTPMLISKEQLFQMKNLLFKHRDPNNSCRLTSNHYMGSVARRPLQPVNSRKVYRCTCRDFLSDAERDAILAEDGLTEENATYTPKCSREEFRKSEEEKWWLRES